MSLIFEGNIELSTFPGNPDPKLVDQLSIIHEATDGELVQYYIDRITSTEGDKNTYAIGVPVPDEYGNTDHYAYVNYPDVIWNAPKARITRQKIDRLGVKAFPGIGAIAFYKLAYRNLSQIVAPVNYNKARQKAPALQAEISSDQYSVTFTVSNPIDPQTHEDAVTYIAFRICLVLDYHQLEYITYEKTLTVTNLPISTNYLCYAIGYINEGEICSYESNSIVLNLKGIYDQWPVYSPGNTVGHQSIVQCFVRTQGTPFTADWLSLTEEGSPLIPDKATMYIVKSGAYIQQSYYWDGTQYKGLDSLYQLSRENNQIRNTGSKGDSTQVNISPVIIEIILPKESWDNQQIEISLPEILLTHQVDLLPPKASSSERRTAVAAFYAAQISEVSHTSGTLTLFAVNVPTIDLPIQVRLS